MSTTADFNRLAARVRAAARHDGVIETAQVRLLGLDEVRAAAGARWPRMRDHVREGSLKIITNRISADDAVIPCGDGFLVVFGDGAPDAVQRACAALREALLAFYLGDEGLKPLRADVQQEKTSPARLADLAANAPNEGRLGGLRNQLELGRFWPIWSPRREMIAAHLCAPTIDLAGGRIRLGYERDFLETARHRDADYLDFDLCLLEQACAAAERPDAAALGVTVHATTMQNRKTRAVYVKHIAANASPALQRMFVAVSEIEPGTPLISLSDWSNALRAWFPRVAFDFHHSDRAVGAVASAGIWAAGYQLPINSSCSNAQLKTAFTELEIWCRTLRKQNVQPMVHGFSASAFSDVGAVCGVSFATGADLWPVVSVPPRAAA